MLSGAAGAAVALLWLKLRALANFRSLTGDQYRPAYLVATLILGAVLFLGAQWLWGVAGSGALGAARRDLRIAWGLSGFPQIFALAILPLDLLIAGPQTFTTERMSDDLSTAWVAISIAAAVGIAVWSLWLFVRGVEVVAAPGRGRILAGVALAAVCLAALAAASLGVMVALARATA